MPHLFGICFGFPSMFLAVGFGLGYMFEAYPLLHKAIQFIGVVYLLYLSWLVASAAPSNLDASSTELTSKPFTFIQAALFQWVNPKAWIMGTSAIATYTTVGADINVQIVLIGAVFFTMAFPSAGVWLLFGAGLKRVLSDPRKQRYFNVSMGLVLALSIVPIIWSLISGVVD